MMTKREMSRLADAKIQISTWLAVLGWVLVIGGIVELFDLLFTTTGTTGSAAPLPPPRAGRRSRRPPRVRQRPVGPRAGGKQPRSPDALPLLMLIVVGFGLWSVTIDTPAIVIIAAMIGARNVEKKF